MRKTTISTLMARVKSLFGRRKKTTLQAPRVAKTILRWIIRKRLRLAYIFFLSWPLMLSFLVLLGFAIASKPKPGGDFLLLKLQLSLAALWALLQCCERIGYVRKAWARRRR